MLRLSWAVFAFVFENVPNIGFWIGAIYFLRKWYSQQHLLIKIIFLVIPFVAIFIILRKTFRELKGQFLKINAESGLAEKGGFKKEDRVKQMINNVPSKKNVVAWYKYASNYARSWASDGKVEYINYYLKLDGNKINKSVQIFIRSKLRNEVLTTYRPSHSAQIEELDETHHLNENEIPHIDSFPHWKEAIEKTIEHSASDIEKCDNVGLQISPSIDSLHLNFTFEKGNREWRKRYTLKEKILEHKAKAIYSFG